MGSPLTRHSSGATGGETLTITERSISHRRTTHSKPSSSGTMATADTASITSTTTTALHTPLLLTRAPPMVPPVSTLNQNQLLWRPLQSTESSRVLSPHQTGLF